MRIPRHDRGLTLAFWGAMAVAFVARVAFLADKPLWRDEAWVALCVADPFAAVANGRASPFGFLLLTQLVTALVPGPPDITYRLIPLAAGLALLPLMHRWTLALGGSRREAVAVTWLAAGLQPLIYYSRELKSYDLDALFAVAVPLLAMRGFAGSAPSARARAGLLAVLLVAPWLTFGGIFAIGALLAWGTLAWALRADRGLRVAWAGCSVAFLLSFAAVYLMALGNQSTDPWMHNYWSFYLRQDRDWSLASQFGAAAWKYASVSWKYFFHPWPMVFAVLAAVGAWRWPREQRGFLLFLCAGTAALCVTAAVLDRYVLQSGRLLLVAAPVPLLWVARGISVLASSFGRYGAAAALALPAAMALWWSAESVQYRLGRYQTVPAHFYRFDSLHDVEAAIGEAARLVGRGEPVLVSRRCAYAFQFYRRGRLPGATYCERHCPGFRAMARHWLRREVRSRGWIILGDEDETWLLDLVVDEGFGQRPHASVRGVHVWEIWRRDIEPRGDRPTRGAVRGPGSPSRAGSPARGQSSRSRRPSSFSRNSSRR